MLAAAYSFDAVESDHQLKFKKRGRSPSRVIPDTWRPHFFGLYLDGHLVASSTAANTATSTAWSIFRFGWGFSTNQDFNGDIALIACFAASWTPAMIRRWNADPFGFLRPWNELPALMDSAPPSTPPPLDRHRRGHLPDRVA
jgi:hypothetical protein